MNKLCNFKMYHRGKLLVNYCFLAKTVWEGEHFKDMDEGYQLFTAVPGGNKAPIKLISKLSKIIRIC